MIPGVSAGTMALITGIYKRLIGGISELFRNFKKSFFSLLPLGIGAVISVLAIMIGIHYGFHYAPVAIVSLFAGIVLGFSPLITKEIKNQKKTAKPILIMIISAIFAALIGILSVLSKFYWNLDLEDAFRKGEWWVYIAVFASGFIAAAACIVPGISGSMILFIFGLYTPILNVFLGEGSMFHNHERIEWNWYSLFFANRNRLGIPFNKQSDEKAFREASRQDIRRCHRLCFWFRHIHVLQSRNGCFIG